LPDIVSANIYTPAGTRDGRGTRAGVEAADIALDLDCDPRKKSRSVVGKLVHKLFKR
jgi:hypothetical protein